MRWIKAIKRRILKLSKQIVGILPLKKKKVLFVSYWGKGYGDEGKAITEELLKAKTKLNIIWAVKREYKDTLPKGVRYVEYNTRKYMFHLMTAKVWLDNARKSSDIKKRPGQYYIHLWHGAYPLKKIEKDVEDHLSPKYIENAKHDSEMANLIISGSAFFTEIIRRAFWYNGEILECGSPKLDRLFSNSVHMENAVRSRFGISLEKKIVLYAPTFRVDYNTDRYDMDYNQILDALEKQSGTPWVMLIRLHPNVSSKSGFLEYSERIMNATDYPDLYELIPVADIIITDYSSIMFEAGIIEKPVFLYMSDLDEYKVDRGFYFNLEDLPFPIAQTNDEMVNRIQSFDLESYRNNINTFMETIHPYETGTAAKAIAERVIAVTSGNYVFD